MLLVCLLRSHYSFGQSSAMGVAFLGPDSLNTNHKRHFRILGMTRRNRYHSRRHSPDSHDSNQRHSHLLGPISLHTMKRCSNLPRTRMCAEDWLHLNKHDLNQLLRDRWHSNQLRSSWPRTDWSEPATLLRDSPGS